MDDSGAGRIHPNFNIPFVLQPGIFAPPIAGSAPRARSGDDAAAHSTKENSAGDAVAQFEVAGKRGRNMRNPAEDRRDRDSSSLASTVAITAPAFGFRRTCSSSAGGLNRLMRNSPGRCVSTISGEPILVLPTSLARRATVSSSFSGSGLLGTKSRFARRAFARDPRPEQFLRSSPAEDPIAAASAAASAASWNRAWPPEESKIFGKF